jgi:RsmE family RNA methyltransferase
MRNILFSLYKIPDFVIKVYTSIPKGNKFEWLIKKCDEMGVFEIVSINTKRSINSNFFKKTSQSNIKIFVAASSQCRRNDIMKINEFLDFKTACKNAYTDKNSINVLYYESENNNLKVETTTVVASSLILNFKKNFK